MSRLNLMLIAQAIAASNRPVKPNPSDDVVQEIIDGMRPSKPKLTKNQMKALRRKNRK